MKKKKNINQKILINKIFIRKQQQQFIHHDYSLDAVWKN